MLNSLIIFSDFTGNIIESLLSQLVQSSLSTKNLSIWEMVIFLSSSGCSIHIVCVMLQFLYPYIPLCFLWQIWKKSKCSKSPICEGLGNHDQFGRTNYYFEKRTCKVNCQSCRVVAGWLLGSCREDPVGTFLFIFGDNTCHYLLKKLFIFCPVLHKFLRLILVDLCWIKYACNTIIILHLLPFIF